jgi:acyl-coenzyme A thioesterase PaaI-like protein
LITFARITRSAAPGMDEYDPTTWIGQVRRVLTATDAPGSVGERLGLDVIDARRGRLELARSSYVVNSIGTIQGGAQAVLIEAAAEAMCAGMAAVDIQIHYLSQLEVGPARTHGRLLREASDHAVVTMKVEDAGHHDQLLSRATVTLWARPARHGPG